MANTAAVLELLDERCIRVGVQAADWREAIRCAGDLLEAHGVCTGEYTQAMIDTVVEKGPLPLQPSQVWPCGYTLRPTSRVRSKE